MNRLLRVTLIYTALIIGVIYFFRSPEKVEEMDTDVEVAPTISMKVTGYCPCEKCCGSWSRERKTSTGDDATVCDGVAADPKLIPYRTKLSIPGIGIREVDDTGGAMRKDAKLGITHIDLRFSNHKDALKWGVQQLNVTVLKPQS